jgi:hypothetical protein
MNLFILKYQSREYILLDQQRNVVVVLWLYLSEAQALQLEHETSPSEILGHLRKCTPCQNSRAVASKKQKYQAKIQRRHHFAGRIIDNLKQTLRDASSRELFPSFLATNYNQRTQHPLPPRSQRRKKQPLQPNNVFIFSGGVASVLIKKNTYATSNSSETVVLILKLLELKQDGFLL